MSLRVLLMHPEVASRSCADCVKYLYHDRGPGQFGHRVERGGRPVARPRGSRTPCAWCPKVPAGVPARPEFAEEMTAKNLQAWCHYLECKAAGEFPPDPLVRRNAALCRAAEDFAARIDQQRHGLTLLNTLMRG